MYRKNKNPCPASDAKSIFRLGRKLWHNHEYLSTNGLPSETAHILPVFKDALKLRRCLVLADALYEWQSL